MSKRLWMPFNVADYLADTGHLTVSEHGAYLLLIMCYWQDGGLPDDDAMIMRYSRLSREQWAESRDVIAAFFDDGWTHKRIDAEIKKSEEIISIKSKAGKWKRNTSSTPVNHPLTPKQEQEQKEERKTETRAGALPPTLPSYVALASPYLDEFEIFWFEFPNKIGKPKARASFAAARRRGVQFDPIMAGLRRYVANKPLDRPWLNPATFLNQDRWADQPASPPVARAGPSRVSPTLLAAQKLMDQFDEISASDTQANHPPPRLLAVDGGRG